MSARPADDGRPPFDPILIATAAEAVLRAGAIQRARFGSDLRIDKKGAIDLVTQVDLEIEQWFRDLIADRFPTHAVLAEELGAPEDAAPAAPSPPGPPASTGASKGAPTGASTGAPGPAAGAAAAAVDPAGSAAAAPGPAAARPRYCWIFDPIDGTVNYAHGLPIFCASLALEIDGAPAVAAVYDPMREELFTAERGSGARLNGTPLRVSSTDALGNAMLCTGFPYDVHETVDDVVGLFGAFVAEARAVRRLGSAALDLCYVAAGRFDGFWEERLQPWDIAAGALLVTEAGGTISSLDGGPFTARGGSIVASNRRVHEAMLAVIRRRAPVRTP